MDFTQFEVGDSVTLYAQYESIGSSDGFFSGTSWTLLLRVVLATGCSVEEF